MGLTFLSKNESAVKGNKGSKLIPKEEKMTNILTNDVQTYVRELISKTFGSDNQEEKTNSENRRIINSEVQKQQRQTAVFGQKIKRYTG